MNEAMTIAEFKAAKQKAEAKLAGSVQMIIAEFTQATGARVNSVRIEIDTAHFIGRPAQSFLRSAVIETELL